MKRAALVAIVALVSCEEHGKSPPDSHEPPFDVPPFVTPDAPRDAPFVPIDAPPGSNPGFAEPAGLVAAWTETASNTFQAATLDLSCLNLMRVDQTSTAAVTVNATIHDFQSGNSVPNATVSAFTGTNIANPFTTATANASAVATLTIPAGTKRFGYKIVDANSRPTFHLDQLLAGSTTPQVKTLELLSNATAQTLPALIGVSATPSLTIAIGKMTDCHGHTLSGTIATISSTSGFPTHLPAIDTFYFSDSVGLPVRHTQAPASTKDGLFMVIEVPATTTAFVQVWGFTSAAAQSMHVLTELAELAVPVPGASALITVHDPRATN